MLAGFHRVCACINGGTPVGVERISKLQSVWNPYLFGPNFYCNNNKLAEFSEVCSTQRLQLYPDYEPRLLSNSLKMLSFDLSSLFTQKTQQVLKLRAQKQRKMKGVYGEQQNITCSFLALYTFFSFFSLLKLGSFFSEVFFFIYR